MPCLGWKVLPGGADEGDGGIWVAVLPTDQGQALTRDTAAQKRKKNNQWYNEVKGLTTAVPLILCSDSHIRVVLFMTSSQEVPFYGGIFTWRFMPSRQPAGPPVQCHRNDNQHEQNSANNVRELIRKCVCSFKCTSEQSHLSINELHELHNSKKCIPSKFDTDIFCLLFK